MCQWHSDHDSNYFTFWTSIWDWQDYGQRNHWDICETNSTTLTHKTIRTDSNTELRLDRHCVLSRRHDERESKRTLEIDGDTVFVTIDEPLGHWNKENAFVLYKKRLILIVTELNGKKIEDKLLKDALFRDSKKYAYDRTKKQDCE
jgi:hypothetical protein